MSYNDNIELDDDAQIEQDIANYAKLKKKKQQQSKSDLSISKTTFTDVKARDPKFPKSPKEPKLPKPPKEPKPLKEPKLPRIKLTAEELRERMNERHRKRYALLKAKKEFEKKYISPEVIEEQRQWLAELEEKRKRAETLNVVRTLRESEKKCFSLSDATASQPKNHSRE